MLYRSALKHSSSWMASRNHWFGEARRIRALFELNKDVTDPSTINRLVYRWGKQGSKRAHPHP